MTVNRCAVTDMPKLTGQQLAERGRAHQFKPGNNANPNGRRLSAAIEKKLAEEGVPEALVDAIVRKVKYDGDVAAFKEIITRHEGNVPTKSEIVSDNYVIIEVEQRWPEETP